MGAVVATRGLIFDLANDRYAFFHGTTELLRVASGAVSIRTGGFTVAAGGITVTGNSTLIGTLGGLTGLTVASGTVTLPANTILTAAVEDNLVQYADVQITNAQVKLLASTPITLVAAPGANRAIIVHRILLVADASNTAWVEPSAPDDLVLQYADGVDITGATVIEGTALVANSVNVRTYGMLEAAVVPDVNAAVQIFNNGGNWTGGNAANTMSIRTWYSVVDTVAFT